MAKKVSFEQVLKALNDGKGVRRSSWKFGYYYFKEDGKLIDTEDNEIEYIDFVEDAMADDWVIVKATSMKDLNDKALWFVTRELVFNQLFFKHKDVMYRLLKYARDSHALAITDAPYYSIVYEEGYLVPTMRNSVYHSCFEVPFNSQVACSEAIQHFHKEIFEVVELSNLLALMQQEEVVDLKNAPFSRAELENLYIRLGGK